MEKLGQRDVQVEKLVQTDEQRWKELVGTRGLKNESRRVVKRKVRKHYGKVCFRKVGLA